MGRTQKLKGLSAASLILKTLNGNPYLQYTDNQDQTDFQHNHPQQNCHITAHAARQGHRPLTLNRSGGSRS